MLELGSYLRQYKLLQKTCGKCYFGKSETFYISIYELVGFDIPVEKKTITLACIWVVFLIGGKSDFIIVIDRIILHAVVNCALKCLM